MHYLYSGGVFQGAGSRNGFSCLSHCTLVTTIAPPVMHAADGCSRRYRPRKNKMNIQSSIPPGQAIPFAHFWPVLLGWRLWATDVFSLAAVGICSTHALLHVLNRTYVPACPTGGFGYHVSRALLERDLPAVSQVKPTSDECCTGPTSIETELQRGGLADSWVAIMDKLHKVDGPLDA